MNHVSYRTLVGQKLAGLVPSRIETQCLGQAAVLMPIVERKGAFRFLLTRRTNSVATHKGQISFPGGMWESSDASLLQTAVRETKEELGIDPRLIDVVGEFHEYLAVTNHRVHPFVGFVESGAVLKPHAREVQYVLEVPLAFFRETQPVVRQAERLGTLQDVYYYDFKGEMIWGLTARMIRDFLKFLEEY